MRQLTLICAAALVAGVAAVPAVAQGIEVSQEGRWRIWYTSPDLRAELSYHWADGHLGDEWIIVKAALAGGSSGVISIERDDVQLRGPDGTVYGLPTQAEFRAVRGSMQMAFRREDMWGPAAARFAGSLRRVDEWFFSPRGRTNHREIINPSSLQYFSGPLVFQVPGGVQPGSWELVIELDEMRARIPFTLGAIDE